ncbi:hypothetical protein [Actinacidiphila oryziradicis]|uniref:Uncharacterized protein n=1 Tax=Actinacidiphila oryziradicis TaxID=2571141 RepID=A0A4U0SFI6_9ACTN|nr:hypothetical protein [Actinacidiphila oryziradicis]TKA08236.1 hypothetical protein FCI23_29660 [Actinacidiphila oryziradicis]
MTNRSPIAPGHRPRCGRTARTDDEQHHGACAMPQTDDLDRCPDDNYPMPGRLPSTDRLTPGRTPPSIHEGSL